MIIKDYRSFIQALHLWYEKPLEKKLYIFINLDPYFEDRVVEQLSLSTKGSKIFLEGKFDTLPPQSLFDKPGFVIVRYPQGLFQSGRKWPCPVIAFLKDDEKIPSSFFSLKAPAFKPYERLGIIKDIAKHRGFDLSYETLQKLKDLDGLLSLWDSQFRIFALVYSKWSQEAEKNMIDHFSHFFETQAQVLDRYLCEEAYNKVHVLIHQRIFQSREQPLKILAFIARHIRTVLKIIGLRKIGASLKQTGLPEFVLKNYQKVAIPSREAAYIRAFIQCQKSDMLLKSTSLSGDLVLSEVIFTLER